MQLTNALFTFFISAGLLILIYLLREKRQKQVIPSTLFWEDTPGESSAYQPRWRLETEPLFFLQLLLLALLALALAAPRLFISAGTADRDLIIILDRSASMQASDVDPDRFTAARDQAMAMVEEQHPGTEISVISAAHRPEFVSSFTTEHGQLLRTIAGLKPADAPLNLEAALRLASAAATGRDGTRVALFTDGSFEELPEEIGLPVEIFQVGHSGDNLGITGLHVRPSAGPRAATYDIQVTVQNSSETAKNTLLTAEPTSNHGETVTREITVPPAGEKRVFLTLSPEQRTPYHFRIQGGNLDVDSSAYAVLGRSDPYSILILGDGNYFLERVLLSLPQTRIFTRSQASPEELENFDIVVFDKKPVPTGFAGYGLFINSNPPGWELNEGEKRDVRPIFFKHEHPILRFVDIDGLRISTYRTIEPGQNAQTLVAASDGPLITAFNSENIRGLVLGFDIMDSNLPLQAGFPVFFANILEWFYPRQYQPQTGVLQAGDYFREFFPPGRRPETVLAPDGRELPVVRFGNEIVIDQTEACGIYTLVNGEHRDYFTVNLLSPSESDITPRHSSQKIPASTESTVEDREVESLLHLWPYLALLCWMLLFFEWYLYHNPQALREVKP